ncbi:hypothetical protein MPTK1_7g17815 [Marchantia polymorpha subsp. ruderalis]
MESKGKGRLRSAAETLLAKPLSSAPENRLRKRMRPAAPQINSTSNELTSNERDVVSLSLRIRSQPFSLVPEGLKSANVTLLPEGLRSAVTKLPKRLKSTAGTLIEKGVRWTFHSIVTVTKYSQIPGESEFAIPEKDSQIQGESEFAIPEIRGDTEFAIPENTKSTKVVYMPSKYYTKLTVNTIFGGKYALDVEPGDHVYSYVNVLGLRVYIYSHHGIFDVDGLIIHNVADRERYNRDLKKCRLENCPTIRGKRKCGIVKTCIECFKGSRALHVYGYNNKNYRYWRPIDGGTTTHLEKSSDREEILKRARDSLDKNDYGEFNLQDNNCEGFAVFCCTGQRGMGNQSWRVGDLMNYVKHVPFIRRITTQIGDHSASSLIVKIGQSFILKRRV